MYINKCTKCGAEFETKNPKRVICPNCLYPERKNEGDSQQEHNHQNGEEKEPALPQQGAYSFSPNNEEEREQRPQRSYNSDYYNREPRNDYNRDRRPRNDGYQRNNYNRQGGYNNRQGGNRNFSGGMQRPNFNNNRFDKRNNNRGGFKKRPQRPQRQKQLLVSKQQLEQIEILYKKALPLPNPNIHEVIGEAIGLEPRKVFFGINLVRQKLMLPKLPFPKRKLAVSPDQLFAIKNLYEPLLPLPPIGCHKIIAAQLKMDEWRVHVGIGLIRKQMGLDRWNSEREDAPQEFKTQKQDEEQQ